LGTVGKAQALERFRPFCDNRPPRQEWTGWISMIPLCSNVVRQHNTIRRMHCDMNYLALLLVVFSNLSAADSPITVRHYESSKQTFNGPDRTITWRAWQESPKGDFRFRTGDRYLGGQLWEHYLGFEQYRPSLKAIKLSMIRLGSEEVREEVVIRPGARYAIVVITNGTMTAHKGTWSWTAEELHE
jgi:hypothetical protein